MTTLPVAAVKVGEPSAELTLDRAAAERRAERIRLRLDAIADNYTTVMPMIREAIEKRDDLALAAARLGIALGSDTKAATSRKGSYGNVTNSEVADFIARNPDIEHAAARAAHFRDSIDAPTSATAYVYWRCARVSARATEEFFSTLGNHETSGKGDPRAALLRRLNSARRNGESLGQVAYVSIFLRAWNAWRKGHQMASIPAESRSGGVHIPVPR